MSPQRLLYSFLLYGLLPVVLLRLILKSRKNKAYRLRIKERFGYLPFKRPQHDVIWLHTVSVGEAVAAKPLIKKLLKTHPNYSLLITSTTPTGSQTIRSHFGDQVLHCYFPYDLPTIVNRFINTLKPRLLIIIETEIWPNLYATCAKQNIPLLMVSARLSKRSTQRYLRIKNLISETLAHADCILVRNKQDQQHFLSLGASVEKVKISGNLKFDIRIDPTLPARGLSLRKQWGKDRLVWVAASTHEGEDTIIVSLFQHLKQSIPDLLLIIVPRHPERFESVHQLLIHSPYQVQRRSIQHSFNASADIILGDSMGEMLLWFAAADLAFIGGSLLRTGGHNPLEATALGLPVVSGPHIFNNDDLYQPLCKNQVAWVELTEDKIRDRLLILLDNNNKDEIKKRCHTLIQQHQGTVETVYQYIKKHLNTT